MPSFPPLPGLRLLAAGAGVVLGSSLQLQQARLWLPVHYTALSALGLAVLVLLFGLDRRGPLRGKVHALALAVVPAVAAVSFGATGMRAAVRLAEQLPAELEGRDLAVIGVIAGLPQRSPEAWRFHFELHSARIGDRVIDLPSRLSLGWYATPDGAELPALRAGQRWQLTLRLKRPHGLSNPHGFDYELYLFEQGVRATGSVRTVHDTPNRLLGDGEGHVVDRLRQSVRDAITARVADASSAGVLAALAVGDQAAIERDDWALYRQTGVAHLMSISGINVTLDFCDLSEPRSGLAA